MEELKRQLDQVLQKLNIEEKKKKIRGIELESYSPSFWRQSEVAGSKMKELAALQKEVESAEKLQELIREGKKEEAEEILKKLELLLYFSGQYDSRDAIVSIHSGQGGVDAMDWAEMLYRMYVRYFEKKGWSLEELLQIKGEEAGIKSVSVKVSGNYVYGYLKKEQGVHRLVRLSPFNADKLRHTSFALVEVLPVLAFDSEFDIKEDDLEWDFFRASSHGGQNVQKVSTAVRLKHIPTGIVTTCQSERSQFQNRENALSLLKAKLWAKKQEETKEEERKAKGIVKLPSWGNQIRSYVLHPYQLVKDLRTGIETSNTNSVLDGDIDLFIEAELKL